MRTSLLVLALGLVASASSFAAEPVPVVQATPLADVVQDSVKGCLTIQKEERKFFRKSLKTVSEHCFNGLVSNESDHLPQAVLEAQTIQTRVLTQTAYVQSNSHTKTTQVSFAPAAVSSSELKIEPAIYNDVRSITPGVVSSGIETVLRFNRKESGELDGNLTLSIRQVEKIDDFVDQERGMAIQLPRSSVVNFEGNFNQPFKALKHGGYVISLDFTVIPAAAPASDEAPKVAKAP